MKLKLLLIPVLAALAAPLSAGLTAPPAFAKAGTILQMEEIVRDTLPGILRDAGIDPDSVARTHVTVETVDQYDLVQGARTWVWLKDREGAVVVSQDASGRPRQVYTTDGLTLPGLPAF